MELQRAMSVRIDGAAQVSLLSYFLDAPQLNSSGDRHSHVTKRIRKQERHVDEDATSEGSDGHVELLRFLHDVVDHLIERTSMDIDEHRRVGRSPLFVADDLHDMLVEMWEEPLVETGEHLQSLKEKAEVWGRYKRSVPPASSQNERTTIPRVSPTELQHAPTMAHRHTGGSASVMIRAPWDRPGVTLADQVWEQTNSIG